MRWMAVAAVMSVLAGAEMRVDAQQQAAPAKVSAAKPVLAMMVTTGTPAAATQKSLLPEGFAGWAATEKPKAVADAAGLDSAHAAALKEYGCTSGMTASYKRSGETLNVTALNCQDVSGAYGAYSFYRQNGWPKAEIGTGGTSDKNRVLFWKGSTVVDASFSKVGPMSASELRDLAKDLPTPLGNRALTPPILANLPQGSLDKQTMHFAQGPTGMPVQVACCPRNWWGLIAMRRQ